TGGTPKCHLINLGVPGPLINEQGRLRGELLNLLHFCIEAQRISDAVMQHLAEVFSSLTYIFTANLITVISTGNDETERCQSGNILQCAHSLPWVQKHPPNFDGFAGTSKNPNQPSSAVLITHLLPLFIGQPSREVACTKPDQRRLFANQRQHYFPLTLGDGSACGKITNLNVDPCTFDHSGFDAVLVGDEPGLRRPIRHANGWHPFFKSTPQILR